MKKLRLTKDVRVNKFALIHEARKFCLKTLDDFLVLVMLNLPVLKHMVLVGNLLLEIIDLFLGGFLIGLECGFMGLDVFITLAT